jgi:hypothetical protein
MMFHGILKSKTAFPFMILLAIVSNGKLVSQTLAPFNFIPDPGFESWTSNNPIFNTDVPYSAQENQFGSYNIVLNNNDKNLNYLSCEFGQNIMVIDGIPVPESDPRERFLLIEYVIEVNPNRQYELSFNYMNPDVAWPDQIPSLSAEIDGIEFMPPTNVINPNSNCVFFTEMHSFNSGNRSQITLSLYNNAVFKYPDSVGINQFSIVGNDISIWGFELYQYCELKDNDIDDISICEGETIPSILKETFDTDGSVDITWEFEDGGIFTGNEITGYTPLNNERVFVEIESWIGCFEYDTFDINVFRFPEQLEIGSTLPAPSLCPCEDAILEIPDNMPVGNFSYLWSADDPEVQLQNPTESVLNINQPGNYRLLITEDNLNCTRELTYNVDGIEGDAEVYVNDINVSISDRTTITFGSTVSQQFIDCGFEEIEAMLLYDYTVLHNADIPYTVEADGLASYPVTIPLNGETEIPFKVLLGLSENSRLELFDAQVICSDYDEFFSVRNAELNVDGICKEPGARLIEPSAAFNLQSSYISSNRLHLGFMIQESTLHTVLVHDITGRTIGSHTIEGTKDKLSNMEIDLLRYAGQSIFVNVSTPAASTTYMLSTN